jgi:hypothetical protein
MGIPKRYLTPLKIGLTVTMGGALTLALTIAVASASAGGSRVK